MAMTQMQLIQSLGEAMAWFERELSWGCAPTELRHLCGRIGELYAALITNGQLASHVNQHGYDVVSAQGERISVKTTATQGNGGHVSFNPRTLEHVDRVIALRVNTEEMQVEILLDCPVVEAIERMSLEREGFRAIALSRLTKKERPRGEIRSVAEVQYESLVIRELESGSIEIERAGAPVLPVKPVLREIAKELAIPIVNGQGNALNTRQLGSLVMRTIDPLQDVVGVGDGPVIEGQD